MNIHIDINHINGHCDFGCVAGFQGNLCDTGMNITQILSYVELTD